VRCVWWPRVASGPRAAGRALLALIATGVALSALVGGGQRAHGRPVVVDQEHAHAHAAPPYAALHDVSSGPEPDSSDWLWYWAAPVVARGFTDEQWRAMAAIAPSRRYDLARIAWCESRWDAGAVGDHGLSRGAWQVQPRYWGPVPATLLAQARQADGIAAVHGYAPWSTAAGCEGWAE